ncbi:MAG TPA: cytochrome c [Candidatus Acidoferrales bacterium]|nr:cytochrome c [Candidatus Acidoferrales bacterium]
MRLFCVALALLLPVTSACSNAARTAARASAAAAAERFPASANDGGRVYATNCASCHQSDGRGVAGAFPPLAGSALVTGPPERLIALVKLGISGRLQVSGQTYDGTMPRWGQLISDEQIAAVVTYIRTSWHNRAGPVTLADVRAVSP